MYWNRFDICEAWYVFAMLWHGGQWSPEYLIFGRLQQIGFRPSLSLSRGPESLNDNGREIYDRLVSKVQLGK